MSARVALVALLSAYMQKPHDAPMTDEGQIVKVLTVQRVVPLAFGGDVITSDRWSLATQGVNCARTSSP